MNQLKVTVTITEDLYPQTTTVDVQTTDGHRIHSCCNHLPKSYFWSDYERAIHNILEEVRIAVKMKEFENE